MRIFDEWRAQVLMRDDFTCQQCGAKENLHAHHIKPWARFPELRFDITNGETLCVACHEAHHGYSLGGRTNEKYRIHVKCNWCGSDIVRKPSKVSRLNFCDPTCQGKGMSRYLKQKHRGEDG